MVRVAMAHSLGIFTLLLAPWLLLGCGNKPSHSGLAGGGSTSAPPDHELPSINVCGTPQEGCACETEDQVIDCGSVARHSHGYTACSMGTRVCQGGKWGACEGDKIAMLPDAVPGVQAEGLGSSKACIDNPCDPYCQVVVDDSKNLDVGNNPGLTAGMDGLALTGVPPDPSANSCTSIVVTPPTSTLTVTAINATTGLLGEYFNQTSTSITTIPNNWAVTGSRIDATISFPYGSGGPGVNGIGTDNFSVRWTGTVTPPKTEAYTFYPTADDGVRLWINGTLVVNAWVLQGATEYASPAINLTAGVPATIKMEYFENYGGAAAELRWSSPSIPKGIIAEGYLTPPGTLAQPFVTSPATVPLTASVMPANCYDGTLTAAWGLDTLDRATVSNAGVVSLLAPLAGPINVTAYVQEFKASAAINVVVDATDVLQAPAGTASVYTANVSSGADTATILYPYDNTVLPLSLKPPVLQWDSGGVAASAVKVRLRYPATGTALFSWSAIMPEPTNYRYTFRRDQWGFFERSAKGGSGRISIQRIVNGQLKDAVYKTITFATAPLRGKIFYTQYGNGNDIMRLDPGGDNAAEKAFPTVNGCPVCHSMSANGAKFATSDKAYSTNGGISKVDANGSLTVLSDFVSANSSYTAGKNDWRGFAWAPLTPDGQYIFATNNVWGNTWQQVVGIDSATRTVSLPQTTVSGGRGIGLLADYYSTNNFTGNSWRRIDSRPDFDWAGTPGGPVPADGFSVVWNGFVEGYFTESTPFEVESNIGVRLTVGGTLLFDKLTSNTGNSTVKWTGNANLTRGQKTAIKLEALDKNGRSIVKLRWGTTGQNNGISTPYALIPQSQLFPSGGPYGAQVLYKDTSNHQITRLESELYADWGSLAPVKGSSDPNLSINPDSFTTSWDAVVEAPATGNITWCIDADDGYKVTVTKPDNTSAVVLSGTVWTSNAFVCAAAAAVTAVTAGDKLKVHIDQDDNGGGGARMVLGWKVSSFITTTEPVPMARTFPPSTWTTPTTGLSATFYDSIDFGGSSLAVNATTPQAYQTFVPTVDFDWGGDRFSYGRALTSSDTLSARFTGRLQPACTGVTEFEIYADDGVSIWIGGERLVQFATYGTKYAARWLDSTLFYDFKVDYVENGSNSAVRIKWKPCNSAGGYVVIPSASFRPTGDTTLNGYIRSGGDNGNGYPYVAWQTPDDVGSAPVDVSSQSIGNWGLGQSVMMVPTFSPDGSKLVFVDGDSATNSGWRKGLSTFDFDQGSKLFKNRRQIVNNFPYGDVIKWPTYESDSKSIIYQTTTPGDMCCRNGWTLYGYMGPSNYFEDPGKLWSVDTSAAVPTPVALDKLNNGERAIDRNKSYQATMLPTAAGGYRWAVFTSTRPYGNTINLPATQQDYSNTNSYTPELNTSAIQSMLWVSAVDNTVSSATDRSHPAFFLPNQAYSESGTHFLNERAYWVTEACRAAGSGASSACDVDEDCCGGTGSPKTAVCRIDTPITSPPTRHCASVPPPNVCIAAAGACTQSSDCCFNYPCVANVCTKPPLLSTYKPTNFTRQYTAECGKGAQSVWRFFDWKAETPPINSYIEIYAESSKDPSTFRVLPAAPTAVAISGVIKVATITGATVSGWVGQDIGALLTAAKLPQYKYLNITVRLAPNTKLTATPKLTDWRQAYSCPPQE